MLLKCAAEEDYVKFLMVFNHLKTRSSKMKITAYYSISDGQNRKSCRTVK